MIAPLHDADECRDLGRRRAIAVPLRPAMKQVLFDGRLAPLLFLDIHHFDPASGQNVVQVIRRAVKFLRADDQVHVRQLVYQLAGAALRHATHEP